MNGSHWNAQIWLAIQMAFIHSFVSLNTVFLLNWSVQLVILLFVCLLLIHSGSKIWHHHMYGMYRQSPQSIFCLFLVCELIIDCQHELFRTAFLLLTGHMVVGTNVVVGLHIQIVSPESKQAGQSHQFQNSSNSQKLDPISTTISCRLSEQLPNNFE